MTVQTHKSIPIKPYEPQCLGKRGRAIRYTDWQKLFMRKHDIATDFVIVNKVGIRFNFLELKENIYQVATRQISAYFKMPTVARGQFFVITDTIKTAEPVKVSYINLDAIETLLGTKGKNTLNKVIDLVQKEAEENNWPLAKIEIQYRKDPEVKDWEYVLMILHFNATFEIADGYLCSLYEKIDTLANSLDEKEQKILQRTIYFDVGASLS